MGLKYFIRAMVAYLKTYGKLRICGILCKFEGSVGARQVGVKVSVQINYAPTYLALTFGEDTICA